MREALDQMLFVHGALAVAIIGTLVLVAESWLSMRRAEKRRDRAKRK